MDRIWFERRRGGMSWKLHPAGRAGWALTIGYALPAAALGIALLVAIGHVAAAIWFAGFALLGAASLGFLALAFRTSIEVESGQGERGC